MLCITLGKLHTSCIQWLTDIHVFLLIGAPLKEVLLETDSVNVVYMCCVFMNCLHIMLCVH